jgi:hypothetical protein
MESALNDTIRSLNDAITYRINAEKLIMSEIQQAIGNLTRKTINRDGSVSANDIQSLLFFIYLIYDENTKKI